MQRRVTFAAFRGTFASWDTLFTEAAAFASRLAPDDLIGISHSADKSEGVVTVWHWTDEPLKPGKRAVTDY